MPDYWSIKFSGQGYCFSVGNILFFILPKTVCGKLAGEFHPLGDFAVFQYCYIEYCTIALFVNTVNFVGFKYDTELVRRKKCGKYAEYRKNGQQFTFHF
jgi:hypothetical protein